MDVSTDVADLFHAVYPRLVVALYATCGNQADAEDAAQEAFTRARATSVGSWAPTTRRPGPPHRG